MIPHNEKEMLHIVVEEIDHGPGLLPFVDPIPGQNDPGVSQFLRNG